ncbi:hypothetical protein [Limosilactobacillus fermentum]|uniref:hypothetical protein n=1 Tax=Limosilactobacillus fermentum TaxID=1613 RepID=UPI001F3708DD|nr:hypothetical protein [Limosilactobacillus fermentum]UJP15665.1 hypothetical protein L1970_09965 [Limosilactobacillus fermentum]
MNQFNKDITLNEVLRRQIEVTANQFLQNELTAVLGYIRIKFAIYQIAMLYYF